MSAMIASGCLAQLRSTVVAFLAPTRLWDWWEFKVPVFLGVAYLVATASGVQWDVLWPRLLCIIAAIVPVASFVCVINEITDCREDELAGQSNCMLGRSSLYQASWVVACLAGGGLALGALRPSVTASWLYAANWLVFTLYSVPPLRLKSRGIWGVVADACGGQLLPTLWTTAFVTHDAASPLPRGLWLAIGVWAFALGCRGILGHQFRDLNADLASGVGTLAVRIGADRTRQVLRRILLPGEAAAFCAATAIGGAWLALFAFVAFMTTTWRRLHAGKRTPTEMDVDSFALSFYGTLFPLSGVIPLAVHAPPALALLPLHVMVFPGAWGLSVDGMLRLFGGSRRDTGSADIPLPADGSVSVVIPAYQGRLTIASCLEALSRQTGVGRLEIVVVESSGDGSAEIVERDFPGVTVVREPERLTAGAARNRGANLVRGRFIIFVDQDCVAPPDWAARLVAHLHRPGVEAVGGSVGIAKPTSLSGAAVYFIEFLNHFPRRGPPVSRPSFLLGCNAAYRVEVLRTVQFPDRTLAEDVLFTERVRKAGFGVIYDPTITVLHHNRTGWAEFFSYARKMGIAAAEYQTLLDRPWARPFLRWPLLAFPAALVISPLIAARLLRSPWRYLGLFVVVAPACVLGNIVWAAAFRGRIMEAGRQPPVPAGQ